MGRDVGRNERMGNKSMECFEGQYKEFVLDMGVHRKPVENYEEQKLHILSEKGERSWVQIFPSK